MESDTQPQEAQEAQEVASASTAIYFPGVYSVDPDVLISHETSLKVYDDQDEGTVSEDREFMRSLRLNRGNIIPILVLASDKRTILSGDRRRTGCKILGFNVNIQYVDPGSEAGDVDLFILNANAGHRPKLTNVQLGRVMRKMRDAYAARTLHANQDAPQDAPVAETLVSASDVLVETEATVATETAPVIEQPTDSQINAEIAKKMGIPQTTVTAVTKVVTEIEKLEADGKVDEAKELTQKLNQSAFKAARTLPGNKKYDKGSMAAIKQIEKVVRLAIKNEVANLKKIAVCEPALVTQISDGFDVIHSTIQRLQQSQVDSGKQKKGSE